MAKKKLGLEDLGGFVFSTNNDFDESEYVENEQEENLTPKTNDWKLILVIKAAVVKP